MVGRRAAGCAEWGPAVLANMWDERGRWRVATALPPCHLSPKPRRVSSSIFHDAALTDSSPRLVFTTSPVAPTQSPRLMWPKPSKSAVTAAGAKRSEEHTSELQSLMRISYAVFCLKKKKTK